VPSRTDTSPCATPGLLASCNHQAPVASFSVGRSGTPYCNISSLIPRVGSNSLGFRGQDPFRNTSSISNCSDANFSIYDGSTWVITWYSAIRQLRPSVCVNIVPIQPCQGIGELIVSPCVSVRKINDVSWLIVHGSCRCSSPRWGKTNAFGPRIRWRTVNKDTINIGFVQKITCPQISYSQTANK